jgi:hypothetical protein
MYVLKDYLRELLMTSMPYRNAYSPTIEGVILFYILPIALGFIVCRPYAKYLSRLKKPPFSILGSLSLCIAFFYTLPWLILFIDDLGKDLYLFLAIAYLFILIPILVMAGIALNLLNNNWQTVKIKRDDKYTSYLILILIIALTGMLNLIPLNLSNYPVGADVYFHIASTNHIANGGSFFNDPRFYEEKNYFYPPLLPLIIAKLSGITHISIMDLWRYYPVIVAPIFILLIFYFSKLITGDNGSSVITLFFVLPWTQILWTDPTPRLFAWSLLILMLIFWHKFFSSNKKIYILYSIFIFVLVLLSHIELAVHGAIIVGIYTVIEYSRNKTFITDKIKRITAGWNTKADNPVSWTIDDPGIWNHRFSLLILLYLSVFLYLIYISRNFVANDLLVFSEVALSTFNPIGAITFPVFLLVPIGLLTIKERKIEHTMILSIAFLYTSVFFYFTLMWGLYHRYFSETAYIGFAILSGKIIATQLNQSKNLARITSFLIIGLLLFSLAPRYEFIRSYSAQMQDRIQVQINIIEDIKNIKDDNAVILTDPNDIINRYMPAMTGKYIFAASIASDKDQQWQVVSVPSYMTDQIQKRVDLANQFLEKPDMEMLKKIRKEYRLTHLLLKQSYYNKLNNEILKNSKTVAKDDGYVLLEINK